MNLLPKSHEEFGQVDYWNTFFKKRGNKAFEWYGEYPELCAYLLKYIKPKDDVLIVGCGNSSLGMDLYDANYKNITNIDISQVVIKQMHEANKIKRPNLVFEYMDATNMSYPDERFSVVLDKGTLDALMPDNSDNTKSVIDKYFREIKRVLRNGGRYICISLLQEHILRRLLSDFTSEFMFRVIRCHEAEVKAKEQEGSLIPVFITVASKFTKLLQPVLEIMLTDGPAERVNSPDVILNSIITVQESASMCNSLYKRSIADEGEVSLDLHRPGEIHPRFTIYILDQLKPKGIKTYAAFIVPQGREMDWLFSTKEGRQQLLKLTQHDRLAIVILRRGHTFDDLEAVKSELSGSIKNLAPANLSNEIPFLSLGSDVGTREICYEGHSDLSGAFVVEEVATDNGIYRRLVFLSNQFVVQSEAKLKEVKSRRGKTKKIVDPCFVACNHHLYMTVGINAALQSKDSGNILIIGLGGGGLCTFLRHYIPQLHITVVEIDKMILKVATDYFDLEQGEHLKVEISDGIAYLEKCAMEGKLFDAILFDVDSKDVSLGMSCPPKHFVEQNVLQMVEKCLTKDGLFLLNLVARSKNLRQQTIDNLKETFRFVALCKIPEDVNEIVFCSRNAILFEDWKNTVTKSVAELNQRAKARKLSTDELLDIATLFDALSIES